MWLGYKTACVAREEFRIFVNQKRDGSLNWRVAMGGNTSLLNVQSLASEPHCCCGVSEVISSKGWACVSVFRVYL